MVPCGPSPEKPKLKTPAVDRYCMCQAGVNTSFSHNFPVKVSTVECFADEAYATYDLLVRLRDENPDVDLAFVIGTDWLQPGSSMRDWSSRNWEWKLGDPEEQRFLVTGDRMLQEFDFLVIKRPGFEVEPTPDDSSGLKKFGPRLSWLTMPEGTTFIQGNLSSTEIRKRGSKTVRDAVGKKSLQQIEGLVPRSVLAYIRRHGFYNLEDENSRRGRIAIFGGAFDPITNSHLTCAANIIHSGCADQVWLVPCGPRPDKASLKTKPLDRYCMCKIAVNQTFSCAFPVSVSDAECFEAEPLFTYDLLCKLKDLHPDAAFSFVIGSDWLQPQTDMSSWRSRNWAWKPGDPVEEQTIVTGNKMLQEFDFLVIPRPGYNVQDPADLQRFGPRMRRLTMPEDTTLIHGNLSSSEIRKRTAMDATVRDEGLSAVEGLVPAGVLAYICREGLYLDTV
uniref:Cytidyltransferase-like domain-containing protein n=1 Tax=Alexandrium andersonii TaxID=327968 RepID=A0A7S2FGR6_9DINO